MRRNYIREKKIICGDSYMAVCLYAITPQERNTRGKKQKKSGERQKARNKMSSLRKKQRKVVANFTKNGFFLSGTFEEVFLPDDFLGCVRETKNYKRRVIAAICKRFKIAREKIKMMLWAVRKGKDGRLHMHGFVECIGLDQIDRREVREMLEDLWRRRIPGTNEYESLGTMNADRIDMKKILGTDQTTQGKYGTVGYIYNHTERVCIETKNLILPEGAERYKVEPPSAEGRLRRYAERRILVEPAFPGLEAGKKHCLRSGRTAPVRPNPGRWLGSNGSTMLCHSEPEMVKGET